MYTRISTLALAALVTFVSSSRLPNVSSPSPSNSTKISARGPHGSATCGTPEDDTKVDNTLWNTMTQDCMNYFWSWKGDPAGIPANTPLRSAEDYSSKIGGHAETNWHMWVGKTIKDSKEAAWSVETFTAACRDHGRVGTVTVQGEDAVIYFNRRN